MISIWEAAQGLLFMASFWWITRNALNTAQATPRSAREEEHGSLTLG